MHIPQVVLFSISTSENPDTDKLLPEVLEVNWVNTLASTNFKEQEKFMLTGPCLNAAARSDWNTVFFLLNIQGAVNIDTRHNQHAEGFRLFDYAERDDNPALNLRIKLWAFGARPSYDVKVFAAAKQGRWADVYQLLLKGLAKINWQDQMHPKHWTLVDYAIEQDHFRVINDLLINWGGKTAEILSAQLNYEEAEHEVRRLSTKSPLYSPHYQAILASLENSREEHEATIEEREEIIKKETSGNSQACLKASIGKM